jgi:hypothetical protein
VAGARLGFLFLQARYTKQREHIYTRKQGRTATEASGAETAQPAKGAQRQGDAAAQHGGSEWTERQDPAGAGERREKGAASGVRGRGIPGRRGQAHEDAAAEQINSLRRCYR